MKRAIPIVCGMILVSTQIQAADLSLAQYLNSVEANNSSVLSSKATIGGLGLKEKESSLIFKPSLFAQAQVAVDKKPTTNVNAQGDRTDNTFGTVGLMEQFNFGLKGKLAYTLSHTKIYNAAATFLPKPDFNDAQLALELSQSLWRNLGGIENSSQVELMDSDLIAKKHLEEFKIKIILSNAEAVYWSVSQLKKMVNVQKSSLDRARKIKTWAENRTSSGLGDKSDLLQSDANVKFREYELASTEQQLKNLMRSFNSLRGMDNSEVVENLDNLRTEDVMQIKLSAKSINRDDTKAAIAYAKLAKANAEISIEKNKPTLELYGSYALNGRDGNSSVAITNGFKTDHTSTAVGVRFQAPLDFSSLIDNIRGYKQDQLAADLTVKQKTFDQEKEWNDLLNKFEDAKINLNLAERMALAQKQKSINERDRLSKGRTTTFQALNFEQDYAQSELLRIKSELEIMNIYAQSKTFISGGN